MTALQNALNEIKEHPMQYIDEEGNEKTWKFYECEKTKIDYLQMLICKVEGIEYFIEGWNSKANAEDRVPQSFVEVLKKHLNEVHDVR